MMQRILEISRQWIVAALLFLVVLTVGAVMLEVFRPDAPITTLPKSLILPTPDPNATIPPEPEINPETTYIETEIEPVVPEPTAPPQELTHTVAVGDTLFDLALRYNTTIERLVSFNQLASPNDLDLGQQLKIPPAP